MFLFTSFAFYVSEAKKEECFLINFSNILAGQLFCGRGKGKPTKPGLALSNLVISVY